MSVSSDASTVDLNSNNNKGSNLSSLKFSSDQETPNPNSRTDMYSLNDMDPTLRPARRVPFGNAYDTNIANNPEKTRSDSIPSNFSSDSDFRKSSSLSESLNPNKSNEKTKTCNYGSCSISGGRTKKSKSKKSKKSKSKKSKKSKSKKSKSRKSKKSKSRKSKKC
jgi:hypothetical protein